MSSSADQARVVPSPRKRVASDQHCAHRKSAKSGAPIGAQTALHLTRELELLEATLLAAERAAICCRPGRARNGIGPDTDIASRRAELDRRELELQDRERAIDGRVNLQDQIHARLARSSESLKRAIRRFRSHVAKQLAALDDREQRLDAARTALIDDRRELARDQMRLKASLRS